MILRFLQASKGGDGGVPPPPRAALADLATVVSGGEEVLNPGGTGSTCRCGVRGEGVLNPGGTCFPCPGGEDHLKRRSSSPPVPPLLGCRHCS